MSLGNPRGAMRPAVARAACHSERSASVRVRPAGSFHVRPVARAKVVAVEAADVVPVRSDPRDIEAILGLSKATYAKMAQNRIWATGYNAFAIPMAAGITFGTGFLMTPAICAVFMLASAIIVAINAQLLRRYRC